MTTKIAFYCVISMLTSLLFARNKITNPLIYYRPVYFYHCEDLPDVVVPFAIARKQFDFQTLWHRGPLCTRRKISKIFRTKIKGGDQTCFLYWIGSFCRKLWDKSAISFTTVVLNVKKISSTITFKNSSKG